jgi:DNA-binding NtrC family response regulator
MSGRFGCSTRPRQAALSALLIGGSFLLVFAGARVLGGPIGSLNDRMTDQLFRLRYRLDLEPRASPQLIHVVVNDGTRTALGLPSWDRRVFGQVLDLLRESEARTIACDVFFRDASLSDNDAPLLDALRRTTSVVLPVLVYPEVLPGSSDAPVPADRQSPSALRITIRPEVTHEGSPPMGEDVVPPFAELSGAAAAFGHINASPGPDGVNRCIPLLYRYRDGYVPALSLAAAMEYFGVTGPDIEVAFGKYIILHDARIGDGTRRDVRIPIDDQGRMILDIPGPWADSFSSFPVQNLLAASLDDRSRSHLFDLVEGALVLISDVSTTNRDHGPGIFESVYPLSGLHVTALNSMLTQDFLTGPTALVSALVGFALALLLLVASVRFSGPAFLLSGLILYAVFLAGCLGLFIGANRIPLMAEPTLAMALGMASVQVGRALARKWSPMGKQAAGVAPLPTASVVPLPVVADPNHPDGDRERSEDREPASRLRVRGPRNPDAFAEIVTRSPLMLSRFRHVEDIAESDKPVLLTGESGVGKELVAKAIHRLSRRSGKFVCENIAGLDDTMVTDTLFGHCRGAFTDAEGVRKGLVEEAHGGTLFLDEIGDLSFNLQVKLLRFIEEKEFRALGSDEVRASDARIIIATNVDLDQRLREGRFREDLFYRLTYRIDLPPLRERREDIPLLVHHFVAQCAASAGWETPEVPEALAVLLGVYPFPGNVRELKNMVENACSRCRSGTLTAASFGKYLRDGLDTARAGETARGTEGDVVTFMGGIPTLQQTEELLVAETLRRTHGNQSLAARLLGLSPSALSRRLKKAGRKEPV